MRAREKRQVFQRGVVALPVRRPVRVVLVAERHRVERRVALGALRAQVHVQDVVPALAVAAELGVHARREPRVLGFANRALPYVGAAHLFFY